MRMPLLRRDARAVERLDVVTHVWDKGIQAADGPFEVEQEVGALSVSLVLLTTACGHLEADLFIRHLSVGVVGCLCQRIVLTSTCSRSGRLLERR